MYSYIESELERERERESSLRRRWDADAHERSSALVGCDANFTASLHCLSKVPGLFDVSGSGRAPRGKILEGARIQLLTDLFLE